MVKAGIIALITLAVISVLIASSCSVDKKRDEMILGQPEAQDPSGKEAGQDEAEEAASSPDEIPEEESGDSSAELHESQPEAEEGGKDEEIQEGSGTPNMYDMPEIDPQRNATVLVEAYLEYIAQGLDGNQSGYAEAYNLVSPHSKKNIAWMVSLSRFKAEASDTYNKYDNGALVWQHLRTEPFGNTMRVYYDSEEGEVYYTAQYIDGLWYVASGNKLGSMFWKLGE